MASKILICTERSAGIKAEIRATTNRIAAFFNMNRRLIARNTSP